MADRPTNRTRNAGCSKSVTVRHAGKVVTWDTDAATQSRTCACSRPLAANRKADRKFFN